MLVVFVSDYSTTMQGFSANYTSTGSAYCSGTTNLNTSDNASFTDGSGGNNYCNNQDCKWLIQPPQATSVTLNFTCI
jgi:bacillolysin